MNKVIIIISYLSFECLGLGECILHMHVACSTELNDKFHK